MLKWLITGLIVPCGLPAIARTGHARVAGISACFRRPAERHDLDPRNRPHLDRAMTRFVVFLAAILLASPAFAQTRHALVIGIDKYTHVAPLQKARNDAQAVAATLDAVGFETELVLDADQLAMAQGLARLANRVNPGDEVAFFFAGHGIEVQGRNYLLPSDVPAAQPGQEIVLLSRALEVAVILDTLRNSGASISLLILDACRDNPFPAQGTRSLGGRRGLARMAAPEGTFVMFSAGDGQAALDRLSDDDPDPNSVFTRTLLPLLAEPGLPIHAMARQVRTEVRQLARTVDHNQFPAVYDQFDGDFALVPGGPSALEAPVAVAPSPSQPDLRNLCDRARTDWALISESADHDVIDAYLAEYAECTIMAALARSRQAALDAPPSVPALRGEAEPRPDIVARVSSRWDHNGSLMGLIANGAARSFVYLEPRTALVDRGVTRGTTLFEGQRTGNSYQGTAKIFRGATCGSFTYQVSGPVSADQRMVTMFGKAPRVDPNCNIVGWIDHRLEFKLQ